MAKAKALPSADTWPEEGLPIDVACKRLVPELWAAFSAADRAARDIPAVMLVLGYDNTVRSSRTADEERHLAAREEAFTALTTRVRRGVRSNEFELWGRPAGSLGLQHIPALAIDGLEIDYEKRTARGEGLPLFYNLYLRRPSGPEDASASFALKVALGLKAAGKISKDISKAALARLIAAEFERAARAGQVRRALKWRSIANQLVSWGLWPVDSIK